MNTISRKKRTEIITRNIKNLGDDQINSIYNILDSILDDLGDHSTRQKKMQLINNNLQFVDEENLKIIDQTIKNFLNCVEIETKENKMYRIMLEIINKILETMNLEQIDDLSNFADIQRGELLDKKYGKIIDDNKDYIFKNGFNKHECNIYQTNVKNLHLSILKGMLKQVGYKLCSKNYKKMENKTTKNYTAYTIKKIE